MRHGNQIDNPVWDLIRAHIVWQGVSTAAGGALDLTDASLPQANLPGNMELTLVVWPGQPGERTLRVTDYFPGGPAIGFDDPFAYYAPGGVPAGTPYVLLSLPYCSQRALLNLLTQKQSVLDCWSLQSALITIPAVAADLAFPDVVVAGIPAGATITRAIATLKIAAIQDTSAAQNQISAAAKTLRIKTNAGAWPGTVCITFAQNAWKTLASGMRGGDAVPGDVDVSAVVTAAGTYNFASRQTASADALVATGASLLLLDVQVGLRVYFV